MHADQQKSFSCHLLIILHFFLGIGALFGGGALILSPNGALLKMPLNLLRSSPFDSFLIPGLILFTVLGLLPLFTAYSLGREKSVKAATKISLYKEVYWGWNFSLYIGFILIIWIAIEMYLIQAVALIHVIYLFWGLAIQAVTLLPSVKKHYSQTRA